MKLIENTFKCKGRGDEFHFYPLGDWHIGDPHCAEGHIRKIIKLIKDDPMARWWGGGDYLNAITLVDTKRFDVDVLPNWMLIGSPDEVRGNLKDIVNQEASRFITMVWDIRDKCLGLIEGNHELSISKYHNYDIQQHLCDSLEVPNLTDQAFTRLTFLRGSCASKVVMAYICHGFGGGRSPGAEPNHLGKMMIDKEADIYLRGHSHTFHIMPPQSVICCPTTGKLPDECREKVKRAANWGTMVKSHAVGAATYSSRACYPARPLCAMVIDIEPHRGVTSGGENPGRIMMRELPL